MTDFKLLDDDALMAEIHAAYPHDPVASSVDPDAFVAAFTRGTLLDVEVDSQLETTLYAAAVLEEGSALFDAAMHAKRLYAALCGILAATDAVAGDYDADGFGGLLVPWPADSCAGLNGLSAALYQGGAQ